MYLVDETGAEVAAYTYDPYGKVLTATGTMAGVNPLRYRGYYQDSETGFYYLQSRYYDPEVGRFINADSVISIDSFGGHNLFMYCDDNPINKVDYTGEGGETIELGSGWYCRIDPYDPDKGTQRHIHIWNKQKGIKYAQNEDGSPHDKGKNSQGKLPKWLQKEIKSKVNWDYNGNRKSFFEKTELELWVEGTHYTFADGTTSFQAYNSAIGIGSVDSNEKIYFEKKKLPSVPALLQRFYISP